MLRVGNEADFDTLFPIYMHPSINPYLSFEIMDKTSFKRLFNELIKSGTLYIYENDSGDLLGTCIVYRLERRCSHVVQLTTLAINPNFHRQGFGTAFVHTLIDHLRKDLSIKRIELFAEVDNRGALNFYEKLGFRNEGCLKNYYKRADEVDYVDELILAMTFP